MKTRGDIEYAQISAFWNRFNWPEEKRVDAWNPHRMDMMYIVNDIPYSMFLTKLKRNKPQS